MKNNKVIEKLKGIKNVKVFEKIKNVKLSKKTKVAGAIAGLGLIVAIAAVPKGSKSQNTVQAAQINETIDTKVQENNVPETVEEKIVEEAYNETLGQEETLSETYASPKEEVKENKEPEIIEEVKEEVEENKEPEIVEEVKEEVEEEPEQLEENKEEDIQEKYEDQIVEFTKYCAEWGLDYSQVESILFAMNGDNNIMYGDITEEDKKIVSDNIIRNIDTSINIISEKQFNGTEKFDLSKAIITTENSEVEKAVLAELQNQVSEFKANPTLENLSKAYHNLAFASDYPVEYKDGEETKTGKLNRNQRDVALKLNALEMYFTIAMDSKLSKDEELKAEILNSANIPYSFAYTDEQLNCEKVYSYMH